MPQLTKKLLSMMFATAIVFAASSFQFDTATMTFAYASAHAGYADGGGR